MAEVAIIATDIAEVIGTATGLNLLFGIPLELGVVVTALDVFLILYLQKLGFRWVEAFVIALLAVIAACFMIQIGLADPNWGELIRGFAPTTEIPKVCHYRFNRGADVCAVGQCCDPDFSRRHISYDRAD